MTAVHYTAALVCNFLLPSLFCFPRLTAAMFYTHMATMNTCNFWFIPGFPEWSLQNT